MKATFIKLAIRIIGFLPLPLARALGRVAGQYAWWTGSRGTAITRVNLKACFPDMPEAERRRLARRSMRHWGMTLFEVPVVWHRSARSLRLIRNVEGREFLDQGLRQGRGVIIVCPHLGNWELMGLWAVEQAPVTALYQPPRRYDLDDLLQDVRGRTGVTLVPTSGRGVANLVKALKRGEIAGVLPDMEPAEISSGVFAPFFGVPALTMTLIHSLCRRTGARVVVGFARRVRGGFSLEFIQPDAEIEAPDEETAVAALNRAVERLVIRAPEQYQWEYKRFKRRPEGMTPLYKREKRRAAAR